MATIGRLNLQLTANPSGFTSALDKSGRALKNFGSMAGGILKSLASPTALFGGVKDFFGEIISEQFDIIDEISKQADVLDLSTEALTGFQHAAELSGVTNEELAKGLEFLTRNLGKAQIVTEAAGASLERFGFNVDELAGMDMESRVMKLADAYVALPPGIDRATFATAAFGKAGIRLSKFLEEGSEGLQKFKAEATLLGRTFTREQGAEVERAGDAIARISLAFDGFKRQVAIGIAPIVADITDKFMTWLPSVGGVPGIFKAIANTVLDVVEALTGIAETIADIVNEIKQFSPRKFLFGTLADSVVTGGVGGTMPRNAAGGVEFTGLRDMFGRARANINDPGGEGNGPLSRMNRIMEGMKARVTVAQQALADEIGKTQEALAKQIATFGKSGDEIKLWELRMKGATDAQLANVVALQQQLAGMEQVTEVARQTQAALVLPSAALAGTAEAVSAINRFNASSQAQNQNARLEELARAELVETRRVAEEIRALARRLLTGDQL